MAKDQQDKAVLFIKYLNSTVFMSIIEAQNSYISTERKKKAQCKSCESSLFSVLLRTIAWETASQRALRNCSKEVRGEGSTFVILAKGVHVTKHTYQ